MFYKGKIEITSASGDRKKFKIIEKKHPNDDSIVYYGLKIRKFDRNDEAIYSIVARNKSGDSRSVVSLVCDGED